MRKIFLMFAAVAAMAFVGCKDEIPGESETRPEIFVHPTVDQPLSKAGGSYEVMVFSSDAWTLTGTCPWARPDLTSGVDGDVVVFEVDPNPDTDAKRATFYFQNGISTYPVTIIVRGSATSIILMSPAEIALNNAGEEFIGATARYLAELSLAEEISSYDLHVDVEILSGEGLDGEGTPWISFGSFSKPDNNTLAAFNYSKNNTFRDRRAKVTIADDDIDPTCVVSLEFVQRQTDRISAVSNSFLAGKTGEDIVIELLTNVEYDVAIEQTGNWMSVKSTVPNARRDGYDVTVGVSPQPQSANRGRNGFVVFTTKQGARTPIEFKVAVSQENPNPMIQNAINFKQSYATITPIVATAPLTNLREFTLETLMNVNSFRYSGGDSGISSVMGIEGRFLVRFGDSQAPNQLQVATPTPANGTSAFGNVSATETWETNRWYHVAVTFSSVSDNADERKIKIYRDGVLLAEGGTINQNATVNFATGQTNWGTTDYLSVGRSFGDNRYIDAQLSEFRVWNKALTAAEINAQDHFYTVENPASNANLVGYWKFNELRQGAANLSKCIEDMSGNGNHFTMGTNPVWVPVSLP